MALLNPPVACLALTLVLSGCAFMRPARPPVSTRSFVEAGPEDARGVVVMLPGYGDRPSDFDSSGFAQRLAQHAPSYDLVGVDLHFNYYRKGQALARLEQDVVSPLRARGYREVWLLGVSMGGLGAVLYAREHPDEVAGLLLFAPFWGRGEVAANVAAAESLCAWDAAGPAAELDEEDQAFLDNWRFLQRLGCDAPAAMPVWVAHGSEDPPSRAGQQLVAELPAEQHVELPGGHGWVTWAALVDLVAPRVFTATVTPAE